MEENVIQINGQIIVNVDVSVKNIMCEKDYIWNPTSCSCENGQYLANTIDDSVMSCDDIIEETNCNQKK